MEQRRLVLDANILIRAVLGRRARELILTHASVVSFFAPEVAFDDAAEHLPTVLTRHDRGNEIGPSLKFLAELRRLVLPIEEQAYLDLEAAAVERIQRDLDDWPALATALLLDCPIWTEDKDFFGAGVATWTTDRIDIYLSSAT